MSTLARLLAASAFALVSTGPLRAEDSVHAHAGHSHGDGPGHEHAVDGDSAYREQGAGDGHDHDFEPRYMLENSAPAPGNERRAVLAALTRSPERADSLEWSTAANGMRMADVFVGHGQAIERGDSLYAHIKLATSDGWLVYDTMEIRAPLVGWLGNGDPYFESGLEGMRAGGKRLLDVEAKPMIASGFLDPRLTDVPIAADDRLFLEVTLLRVRTPDEARRAMFNYSKSAGER